MNFEFVTLCHVFKGSIITKQIFVLVDSPFCPSSTCFSTCFPLLLVTLWSIATHLVLFFSHLQIPYCEFFFMDPIYGLSRTLVQVTQLFFQGQITQRYFFQDQITSMHFQVRFTQMQFLAQFTQMTPQDQLTQVYPCLPQHTQAPLGTSQFTQAHLVRHFLAHQGLLQLTLAQVQVTRLDFSSHQLKSNSLGKFSAYISSLSYTLAQVQLIRSIFNPFKLIELYFSLVHLI